MAITRQRDAAALPAHAHDLEEILAEAFRLFARGVADRRSAFRTPTVATIGADGAPRARTMVLRRFNAAARNVTFHSDQRSAKVIDLAADARAAIHVYDAHAALQLRLAARVRVHAGDEAARAAWAAGNPSSHVGYAISPAPGAAVPAPPPASTDPDSGFSNFALLVLSFDTLEWLWLYHGGHRRARFAWDESGAMTATWLVP
jgi:hypothetical protein